MFVLVCPQLNSNSSTLVSTVSKVTFVMSFMEVWNFFVCIFVFFCVWCSDYVGFLTFVPRII